MERNICNKERYYQHMSVRKLETIIQKMDYYNENEEIQRLIKTLDKKIKRRYSPEMNRKEKSKSFSKYKKRG